MLIGRWRLLQLGGCQYNQFKILVCTSTTASQEDDTHGYRSQREPFSGNQQWFLCVFARGFVCCLLTISCSFVRTVSGSWKNFIASILATSHHSCYVSWTLTYPRWNEPRPIVPFSAPNGRKIIFVYSHSKHVCLICNATVALTNKGNLERHFKTVDSKRATRGASLPRRLYVPRNFGLWQHSLQHGDSTACSTAVILHQTGNQGKRTTQLLLPVTSVTSLLNTRSH